MTDEQRKARREDGRRRSLGEMSVARRVQRGLMNGRPPASELRTPHAALVAAKTLHSEIKTRIEDETHGQRPRAGDYFAVAIAYVAPDLSLYGFSPVLAGIMPISNPEDEARIERALTGNVAIGLIFGIADGEEIVMGARPFLATKQADAWLSELMIAVKSEFEIDRMDAR